MNILDLKRSLLPLSGPQGDSGGGGGGSSNQTSSQTTTQDLPEWAKPYAQDVLSKGKAITDINQNPYQAYGGNRIAGFSDLQNQSFQGAQNMTPSAQIGQGTAAAVGAGLGGMDVANQATTGGFQNQVGGYMNPYMNQILAPQLAEANRNYDIGATKQQSAATQAGAFGGSREAIMAAENERNRNTGLNQIYGQGLNTAFTNAQNQYNQNLGTQLQGYGMLGNAANTLGNLGQTQYQQNMGINALQNQYGGQQQAQEQKGLDTAYNDFLTQKNYPYQQLSYMANLVRGTPMGMNTSSQVYQAPPNALGQVAGLGLGAYGLSKMAGGGMAYADGGDVGETMNDPAAMAAEVHKLTDEQLQGIIQHPTTQAEFEAAQQELAMRASEHQGMMGAYNQLPQQQQQGVVQAAGGGILAFKEGGDKGEEEKSDSGVGGLAYLATMFPALKDLAKPAASAVLTGGKAAAQGVIPTARGLGAAYMAPASGAVLGGGLALSEGATKALSKATPEQLEQLEGLGADPSGTSFAASIMRQAKENTAKKNEANQPSTSSTDTPYDFTQFDAATDRYMKDREKAKGKANINPQSVSGGGGKGGKDTGTPTSSLEDEYNKMEARLKGESKGDMDALNKLMEKSAGRSKEIKDQGFGKAISDFGFQMAAAAAKPGQAGNQGLLGVLRSAAEASPTIAASVAKTNEMAQAADDNQQKLAIAMQQFQIAQRKGDRATALGWASQVRQLQQVDKQIAMQRDHYASQAGIAAAQLAQRDRQFGQMMGVRGLTALAATENAKTNRMKLEGVARQKWEEGPGMRLERDLVSRYGKNWSAQPEAQAEYKQKKNTFILGESAAGENATPYSSLLNNDDMKFLGYDAG